MPPKRSSVDKGPETKKVDESQIISSDKVTKYKPRRKDVKSDQIDESVKDKWTLDIPDGVPLTDQQKKQKAYLIRMKKINKTPRRMKKGKNRHIRCDQGKPTGRSTPWAQALKLAKEELQIPVKGAMIFPRIGTELHTTATRIMRERRDEEEKKIEVN